MKTPTHTTADQCYPGSDGIEIQLHTVVFDLLHLPSFTTQLKNVQAGPGWQMSLPGREIRARGQHCCRLHVINMKDNTGMQVIWPMDTWTWNRWSWLYKSRWCSVLACVIVSWSIFSYKNVSKSDSKLFVSISRWHRKCGGFKKVLCRMCPMQDHLKRNSWERLWQRTMITSSCAVPINAVADATDSSPKAFFNGQCKSFAR